MEEIYKDKKDYEGLYQVSNFGNVMSLNYYRSRKPGLLIPVKNKDGYLQVTLCKDRKKKTFLIHRLVGETFLENPNNLPEINHKDEDKTNNRADNLEWCTSEYNLNYGTINERIAKALSKPVLQFSLTGEFIREWPSTMECNRNGFRQSAVARCCRGEKPQYKGFIWRYK